MQLTTSPQDLTAQVLGFVTPYLLLGRRRPWRRLVVQAGLTAGGMTALGVLVVAAIYGSPQMKWRALPR